MSVKATPTYKLTPSAEKVIGTTNYIDLYDFSSQYLPDTHDELANIYGNQGIQGLLQKLGAEGYFASDTHTWAEEGRLHTNYQDVTRAGNVFTKVGHVFRVNETVHISDNAGVFRRGIITSVTNNTFTVEAYANAGFAALATTDITVFVYGSEYRKGTNGMQEALETDFTILENSPIIMKELYKVSGSNATQVGWVKTTNGQYLWYLESLLDTRKRWEDKLEMAMLLGGKAEVGSDAATAGYKGTEGMFDAIRTGGNCFQGLADNIGDWEDIVKRFDKQGHIQDYMFLVDREQSLAIDRMLGQLNRGDANGLSYGMFNNDKDMAVNLGFSGFQIGSYNFFKKDYRLLNDPTLLGSVEDQAKIRGVLIPMGTKEVYEGATNQGHEGTKTNVPFLQCMYRSAANENRKSKTWVTGSVGNVRTNDEDNMNVHYLSERMLKVVGRNNFMLFEGV